ncbi:MAG: hypothetical protein HRU28_06590, partial [Rhizobiales bacterium]|nr:hypothetical protein [Hyphomicrobiales bacterium]
MNRLIPEVNIAADEFNQFTALDDWINTAFRQVALHKNLKILPNGEVGLLLTTNK